MRKGRQVTQNRFWITCSAQLINKKSIQLFVLDVLIVVIKRKGVRTEREREREREKLRTGELGVK